MKTQTFDLVVAGGGPAGVAAAIGAVRAGARVALIEETGNFGGMATSGLVPVFNPFSNGKKPVIRGVGLEVLRELRRRGSATPKHNPLPREIPEYDWVSLDAEILKVVFDDLLAKAGVHARLFTQVTEPAVRNGVITGLRSWSKSGEELWKAGVFVDATGDADVAARAGCPFEKGDKRGLMQPSTVCFVIAGLTPTAGRFLRDPKRIRPILKAASLAGKLTGKYDHHYCLDGNNAAFTVIGFNYKHQLDTDGTDAESLTRAIVEGRRMAQELCAFLKKTIKGCQACFIASTARLVGVRETRRIVGEYRMESEHFFARRKSADDIADYGNEVDVHVVGRTLKDIKQRQIPEHDTFLKIGEYYGIPYRALIPKGAKNLLVAGRAISCDRAMQGSTRPMPACFATGQAAGVAARLALKCGGKVRDVAPVKLQSLLIKQGAYIDL